MNDTSVDPNQDVIALYGTKKSRPPRKETTLTCRLGGCSNALLPRLLLHIPHWSDNGLEVLSGRAGPRPASAAPRALCFSGLLPVAH